LGKFVARLAGNGRMIQIAPQIRILVAVEAVDGRNGIDAIAQLCQEKLNADPFSGYLFIFRTRRGTAIRVLLRRKVLETELRCVVSRSTIPVAGSARYA
jgi:hypothetical protein